MHKFVHISSVASLIAAWFIVWLLQFVKCGALYMEMQ